MSTHSKWVYVLVMLLASMFLAAQLHCCVDLNSPTMDSHACPVCHTLGAAIATCALVMASGVAVQRLEILASQTPSLLIIFRSITPRAPPISF